MPTTDHEASRTAFEARLRKAFDRVFTLGGDYAHQAESDSYSQNRKAGETKEKYLAVVEAGINDALDWRESQVCEWKRLDWFPDGSYILQSLCDGYAHDLVPGVTGAINYCPNCGRRVKIQPTTDTNHTEA